MAVLSQRQRKVAVPLTFSSPRWSSPFDAHRLFLLFSFGLAVCLVLGYVVLLQSTLGAETAASSSEEIAKQNESVSRRMIRGQGINEGMSLPKAGIISSDQKETLILSTKFGDLRIVLRPDFSAESSQYIRNMVNADEPCRNCNLYRAEKPGILQGIIANPKVPIVMQKGSCPAGYEQVQNDCPAWDAKCQCHGPVMTRGMVGWAAGRTGPDFFIDDYKRKADWWGTQHTVWGIIEDDQSFAVMDQIWTLPTHKRGGLNMLDEPIQFEMSIQAGLSEAL